MSTIRNIDQCDVCGRRDVPAYGRSRTRCTKCENGLKAHREKLQRAADAEAVAKPKRGEHEPRRVSFGVFGDENDPATLRAIERLESITDSVRPVVGTGHGARSRTGRC